MNNQIKISNSVEQFLDNYLERETSIAKKIIRLLSDEKVTYNEWKDIQSFVKNYVEYKMYNRVIDLFIKNHSHIYYSATASLFSCCQSQRIQLRQFYSLLKFS